MDINNFVDVDNILSVVKNLLKIDGKLHIKLLKIINCIQDDIWS